MQGPTNPSTTSTKSAWVGPLALALVVVVAILALTTFVVVRQVSRIPAAVADNARDSIESLRELAEAFRQGTVETRFRSYATSVSGSTYLQVAAIDRVEVITREDRASVFWGAVQLPEVVVSASAPVHYTAYVDLEERWDLELTDGTLRVIAPRIHFNPPAVDVSNIQFVVETDSLLRDEEHAVEELKRELTSQLRIRTRELLPLVRDTARSRIARFVESWLLQSFPEAEGVTVTVDFIDELQPQPPVLERDGPD